MNTKARRVTDLPKVILLETSGLFLFLQGPPYNNDNGGVHAARLLWWPRHPLIIHLRSYRIHLCLIKNLRIIFLGVKMNSKEASSWDSCFQDSNMALTWCIDFPGLPQQINIY
jgi:hypothetical protein